MSKARARERAKLKKGKKRVVNSDLPTQKFAAGRFNPESSTIKSPRANNVKNLSVTKRGANRSG
jgi:hypothetical protein